MEMHIPGLMCRVKPNSARPPDEIGDHRMGFWVLCHVFKCLYVCLISVRCVVGAKGEKNTSWLVEATSWDTFCFFVFHVCYSLLQGIKYFMLLSVVVTVHFLSQVFMKTWLKCCIFLCFLSSPWRTSNVSTRLCSLHPPAACSLYCDEGFSDAVRFLRREAWMSWQSGSLRERTLKNKHEVPFTESILLILMYLFSGVILVFLQ